MPHLEPTTVLTDPVPPLLELLVNLGLLAAVTLGIAWVTLYFRRRRLIRTLAQQFPEHAGQLRKVSRATPLMHLRPPQVPTDPYARTHRVVVAPLGDGRPGEAFWAPGPSVSSGGLGPDGSRQDARVVLTRDVHMLVVGLGRVGSVYDGHERPPAAERAAWVHEQYRTDGPGAAPVGPVDRVDTAMGVGWRTTKAYRSGKLLTDTHVDHDGWAFVIGVLSSDMHARAVEALDHVLTTWTWLPDEGR